MGKYFTRENLKNAGIFASHLFLPGYSTYRLRQKMQEIDRRFETISKVTYTAEEARKDRRIINGVTAAFLLNDIFLTGYSGVLSFYYGYIPAGAVLVGSRILQGMSEWRFNEISDRLGKKYETLGRGSGDEDDEGSAVELQSNSKAPAQYKLAEA